MGTRLRRVMMHRPIRAGVNFTRLTKSQSPQQRSSLHREEFIFPKFQIPFLFGLVPLSACFRRLRAAQGLC